MLRWHQLRPWPDTVAGLTRLRARWITGTLSNGGVRLLTDLARFAPLPMDVILSAELFRHYKRDPEVYRGAVELLGTTPERVMLVAAHNDDLLAAKAEGLRTAFIARPTEYGPQQTQNLSAGEGVEFAARDLNDLAEQLGAELGREMYRQQWSQTVSIMRVRRKKGTTAGCSRSSSTQQVQGCASASPSATTTG